MQGSKLIQAFAIVFCFLFAFYGQGSLPEALQLSFEQSYLRVIYHYLWWTVPTIVCTAILYEPQNVVGSLGLQQSFGAALGFSAISVLPMLLSSALLGKYNGDLSVWRIVHLTLLAGLFEEFLFRAFLFGLLFRYSGLGFIPAASIGAIVFGLGHLYQGNTVSETVGVFLVTAMGAVWFAWLYAEWDFNLWIPALMHTLMNLSWILFDVSANAVGGLYTNLFRGLTIALSIVITIRYHKKRGLLVRKHNLIVHKALQV